MISRSATLFTEACKPECIAISRSSTLGAEVSQLECIAIVGRRHYVQRPVSRSV